MSDGRFERRYHRIALEYLADFIQIPLLAIGFGALAAIGQSMNGWRIYIGGGADASGAAPAQRAQQEGFAACKDVKSLWRELRQHGLGIVPISRGVFDPGDNGRIRLEQPFYQGQADAYLCDWRDMIQIDPEPIIANVLNDFREVTVQTFIGYPFVVEGRQHQDAGAAMFDCMPGQAHSRG